MNSSKIECNVVLMHSDFIMQNHHVHDVSLMPGATFLDIVFRIIEAQGMDRSRAQLRDILFPEAIATTEGRDRRIRVTLEPGADDVWQVRGQSQFMDEHEDGPWRENFRAQLQFSVADADPVIDVAALIALASRVRDTEEVYRIARSEQIIHGAAMKCFGKMYQGDGYLLAEMQLDEANRESEGQFYIHPAKLDSSTLLAFAMTEFDPGQPFIPVYIQSFRAPQSAQGPCYVYVPSPEVLAPSKDVISNSYFILNAQGEVLAHFGKLTCKCIRNSGLIRRLVEEAAGVPVVVEPVAQRPATGADSAPIATLLTQWVAQVLGIAQAGIDPDAGFYDLGLESVQMLALSERLQTVVKAALYPTLLFEFGSIRLLSQHLCQTFGADVGLDHVPGAPSPQASDETLRRFVIERIAERLGIDTEQVATQTGFYSLGLESVDMLKLSEQLGEFIGQALYPTLLFEFPDIDSLTQHLNERYGPVAGAGLAAVSSAQPVPGAAQTTAEFSYYQPVWQASEVLEPLPHLPRLMLLDVEDALAQDFARCYGLTPDRLGRARLGEDLITDGEQHLVLQLSGSMDAEQVLLSAWQLLKMLCDRKVQVRLCLLVTGDQVHESPSFRALAAFVRTVLHEMPGIWCRMLAQDQADAGGVLREFGVVTPEPAVWVADGGRHVLRFAERRFAEQLDQTQRLRRQGKYLIAGGAGGIGRQLAEFLARSYGASIMLLGRRSIDETAVATWRRDGLDIHYLQADLTAAKALDVALAQTRQLFGELNGVMHCAGEVRDALFFRKQRTDIQAVLAPKLAGVRNLDRATRRDALDFFVTFSSISASVANIGQSDYAYANAYLEAYTDWRATQPDCSGLSLAIGWPYWREGGMTVSEQVLEQGKQRSGLHPMSTEAALSALQTLLACAQGSVTVAYGDTPVFQRTLALTDAGSPASLQAVAEVADAIAIIGLAGRYPGSESQDEFWQNLADGRDCVREVPVARWDHAAFFDPRRGQPGRTYGNKGGFIDRAAHFDAAFFGISRRDAELMDPQERQFLTVCWQALEDAGYTPQALEEDRVGVFAGVMWNHYQSVRAAHEPAIPTALHASVANRVSYCLNLRGPSVSVDTMCSSSLTALHFAAESLRSGECDLALAGGVNLILHPDKYLQLAEHHFLSDDGLCRSFGEGGTGYVPGEGAGVVLLKSLKRALADGDHVYAVIRGSALNHSGKTSGYTVPSPAAQASLLHAAMQRARIDPRRLDYIEAHGTGTSLGDPIEVEGIRQAFKDVDLAPQSIAIGSVKSNIGHLESAAGIAAVSKVLLQMRHGQLAPSLHAETLNPHIDFAHSPVRVQRELGDWPRPADGSGRVAGISAFGAGGSNVHMLLEEYPASQTVGDWREPNVFTLSARSEDVLRRYVQQFVQWLRRRREPGAMAQHNGRVELVAKVAYLLGVDASEVDHQATFGDMGLDVIGLDSLSRDGQGAQALTMESRIADCFDGADAVTQALPNLRDMSYTLQTGRSPMAKRLAVVVSSASQLIEALESFVHGGPPPPGAFWGESLEVPAHLEADTARAWFQSGQLVPLARAWQAGAEVIWKACYAKGGHPSRVSLPVYPFDEEHLWLGGWRAAQAGESSLQWNGQTASAALPTAPAMPYTKPVGLHGQVRRFLDQCLSKVLYLNPGELDPTQSFSDAGLESTGALEVINTVNQAFALELEVVAIFDHPSIDDLTRFIEAQLEANGYREPDDAPARDEPAVLRMTGGHAPGGVAIIGMSGRFADAPDLEHFWENLARGRCSAREVDPRRWGHASFFNEDGRLPGKTNTKTAALLDEVDRFDAGVFNISPLAAQLMDPQQRLFLEEAWAALEDAGYGGDAAQKSTCGVYVGCAVGDYIEWIEAANQENTGEAFLGVVPSILAARISYRLNLSGPALAVDTACSSSLVAIHLACESIRSGECDMALAGGVALMLTPQLQVRSGKMGILSPSGRCAPFDADANGTVLGEGAGVVVLKNLEQALRDADNILGVVYASGSNSDGKSNGITAPSADAQEALVRQVLSKAGLSPSDIGYIETHGTGTLLGDPIEVNALKRVFGPMGERGKTCGLGSVKSNIGHTTMAAGVASLMKLLLGLRHRQQPPTLQFSRLNPKIDLSDSPLYICAELSDWQPGPNGRRLAGVSSFGFSGTNCHLVVGDIEPAPRHALPAAPAYPVMLSGRTPAALLQRMRDLRAWLGEGDDGPEMADLAFTLAAGRSHFPCRQAWVVTHPADLRACLDDALSSRGSEPVARLPAERLSPGECSALMNTWAESPDAVAHVQALQDVVQAYVAGAEFDWSQWPQAKRYRRISLPTYPFARDRHWLDHPQGIHAQSVPREFHVNQSENVNMLLGMSAMADNNDDGQVFTCTLAASAWLVADHVVNGQPVLPGVASLEMAVSVALNGNLNAPVHLAKVRWLRPFIAGGDSKLVLRVIQRNEQTTFTLESPDDGPSMPYVSGLIVEPQRELVREIIDLASIAERANRSVSNQEIYQAFADAGINYGERFRVLESVSFNDQEALGRIVVEPSKDPAYGKYHMHPSVMDGAFQAIAALQGQGDGGPVVPFALDTLEFVQAITTTRSYSYVKRTGKHQYSVLVTDAEGQVCIRCQGFSLRATRDVLDGMSYVPVWREAPVQETAAVAPQRVLILHAPQATELARALQRHHAGGQVTLGALSDLPDSEHVYDAIYFLAGASGGVTAPEHDPTMRLAFLLIKQLIDGPHRRQALSLKFVLHGVVDAQAGDTVQSYGAGLLGMARAVASEYSRWNVDCIDAGPYHASSVEALAPRIARERAVRGVTALRGQKRLQRIFETVRLSRPASSSALVKGGTYLVIGGAGGLGFEVSRYLARSAQARLAWVGRRPEDDSIRDKIRQVASLGGQAEYFQADLCDETAMRRVVEQIGSRQGTLRGVLHIGGVFRDMSLATMDEAAFNAVLAPKVTGMAVLERVLHGHPIDFLLLFSTAASFVEAGGQANYAAASTFEDAFALNLRARSTYPVCVINWGYWGSIGAVSGESYRKRMAAIGLGSIEIPEAAEAIERILVQRLPQTLVIKAQAHCLSDWFGIGQGRQEYTQMPEALSSSRKGYQLLETLSRALLAEALQASGWMPEPGGQVTRDELGRRAGVQPGFARLFDALLDAAVRSGGWRLDDHSMVGAAPVQAVAPIRQRLLEQHPDMRPHVALLETCVGNLMEVIAGRRNPMEVLFPKGSMALVQQIYKGQVIANFYNELLARAVVAAAKRVIEASGRPVRILEIGAGTGGTTSGLLPALAGLPVEYCYTDVSSAFLLHGKQNYAPDYPYLTFELLDIGKSPQQQGFAQGSYDIVLATMVLHVVPDLAEGMRNIAWLLGTGGEVFVNEVTRVHDFLTLTFGLLSGWWAYQDNALRLPHAPMSSTQQWRSVLDQAGFGAVRIEGLPGLAEDDLDQALIVAAVRGVKPAANAGVQRTGSMPSAPTRAVPQASAGQEGGGLANGVMSYLKRIFAETLKFDPLALDEHATFESFGVDSLIGQNITARLENDFGNLPATLLFEYMTLFTLAGYLCEAHASEARLIGGEPQVASSVLSAAHIPSREEGYEQDASLLPRVRGYLKRVFGDILKFEPAELDEWATFESFGVDSLNSQKIIAQLELDLGDLPATLLFEQLTIEQLGQHLVGTHATALGRLLGSAPATTPAPAQIDTLVPLAASPAPAHEPVDTARHGGDIAVIGVCGRYPNSSTVEQLWQNLALGADCVGEVPSSREDWQAYLRQGLHAGPAGYLDQVDQFDPGLFGILPRDAVNMDPQERLFLETCWSLLESAGHLGEYTKEVNTGVFVGSMYGAYGQLAATRWDAGQLSGGHSAHWSLANRVSYCFNLQGPSFAVDSACSSSLTAVHLACESLLREECRVAIAGGVNVILHPAHFASLGALNMLSSHGRSMVFDARADGFAPGEGVGAVLLKPLAAAEADGDTILAVIKGSLVNAGGKTGGYTVPNPNAQAQLIERVFKKSGVEPQTVSYVELHGTGTALGDPIEVGSLTRAFKSAASGGAVASTAIGSVKANVGHLEGAAGIVGLTKVLLQFKHKQLVPCLHLETLNPKIDFEHSPFHPQRQLQPWERPLLDLGDGVREYPRRAGLSSFGAGGANAHLILEEYEDRRAQHVERDTDQPVLFVLSARTRERLAQWADDNADFIESAPGAACSLDELAYTSQTGRREMGERVTVIARDHATLAQALRTFARGEEHAAVIYDDGKDQSVKEMLADEEGASFIVSLLQKRNLAKLGQAWVQGVRIDWRGLWRGIAPKRVELPGYPFEHKRYWIDLELPVARPDERVIALALDPNAFYCLEHRIRGQRWLPGMFYLEWVRQALGRSGAPLRFGDVRWLSPLNLEKGVPSLQLRLKGEGSKTAFQISGENGTVYCDGHLGSDYATQPEAVDMAALGMHCPQPLAGDVLYEMLLASGLDHGPGFKVIRHLQLGDREALAELAMPASVAKASHELLLHPSILDGALQSLAALDRDPHSRGYVPIGFDNFSLYAELPAEVLVWAREVGQETPGARRFDLSLLNPDGQVLADISGLRIAPMLFARAAVVAEQVPTPAAQRSTSAASTLVEVEAALQNMAAGFLMVDEADVDLSAELLDSGFDSVSLTELLTEVNQHFGLDLLPQVLFDCPTLSAFAHYVAAALPPMPEPPSGGSRVPSPSPVAVTKADILASPQTVHEGSAVAIRRELQRMAARFLMLEPGDVDLTADFLDSGFDSVSLTELLVEVNQAFGLDLLPQVLFDCPTLEAFSDYLLTCVDSSHLGGQVPVAAVTWTETPGPVSVVEVPAAVTKVEQERHQADDPIAIIGIAGRMPKSEDLDAFWAHLMAGDDLVQAVPAERTELNTDPAMHGIRAGFIDNVGAFDARFFKIAPSEAASMDPQQRVFLEVAWRAIEDAGYPPSSLAGSTTGVFVGVGTTDYNDLMTAQGLAMDGHTATGIAHSILANRVSYVLDLQGPSEAVDTACSSALVAIHRAVSAIRNGECDKALAGGVNLTLAPGLFEAFTQSGMLSADARCKTFDADADGYVRGEGAGAVLLAPLSAALAEGAPIYAVIRGSAVSHGGRTNSLTAPSSKAQARAIVQAYRNADIDPASVSYVEAHGTGTRLGDPIEVEGLKMAFAELAQDPGRMPCAVAKVGIGSVKTHIGHLEAAAGIAGLLKVVLAMKHGQLPGNLHFRQVNPFLRLESTPFYVVANTTPWPRDIETASGSVQRAGISSFGFGGTNAHVIVESYPARAVHAGSTGVLPFLLSAPSAEALLAYAASLARFIEKNTALDLRALAATLAHGREAFPHRLVVLAQDAASLVTELTMASQGMHDSALSGLAEQMIPAPANGAGLRQMAQAWVVGAQVDWHAWLPAGLPRLGGVVSFAFARKHHWFSAVTALPAVHEAVHTHNVSQALPLPLVDSPVQISTPRVSGKIQLSGVGPVVAVAPVATTEAAFGAQPMSPVRSTEPDSTTAVSIDPLEIAGFLREALSELLDIPVGEIDETVPFVDLGLDSIFGIQLIRRLNQRFGWDVQAAQVYEHNTVELLTDYCEQRACTTAGIAEQPAAAPAVADRETTVEAEVIPAPGESLEQRLFGLIERTLEREPAPEQAFSQWMTSFDMLRVISALEGEFGPLKKSLLFDMTTIAALAAFLGDSDVSGVVASSNEVAHDASPLSETPIDDRQALFVKKQSLPKWPELDETVRQLHLLHGKEGGLPGRDIAPYVFIGKRRLGYFNCSQAGDVLFSFSYVGTEDYAPELAQEYIEFGREHGMKANFLSLMRLERAGDIAITATPFGVVQRLENLAEFTLSGSKMRKLRYLVNKFEASGQCRTEEYRVGSDPAIDQQIVAVIDQWASTKQMVNPYVATVRAEIGAGVLAERHRMFLTFVDDTLANAIIVTHIPSENGYLLDLEFYGAQAPAGGLEFAIAKIFEQRIAEGDTFFSFGGTFGVKVCDSANADVQAERTLQELRELGLVNNDGNVQFKNKFAPTNLPVYLCRADEADSTPVSDILLMIASPKAGDTPVAVAEVQEALEVETQALPDTQVGLRERQLRAVGYNPVRLAPGEVPYDLMTDSWSELEAGFISGRMAEMRSKLLGGSVDYRLDQQTLLPFKFVRAAGSGRTAEAMLCRALPKRGRRVLSNALFPSWTFNLMDHDLSEVVVAAESGDDSGAPFSGNFDLSDLEEKLLSCPNGCAFVAVELSNNARGGRAVSLANLRLARELAHRHDTILVMDATRLLENALCIIQNEEGFAEQDLWDVAGQILQQADAVSMGMSKDFGCSYGGLVATSDASIATHIDERAALRGNELNLENRSLLARVLGDRTKVRKLVTQRMQCVAQLWQRLRDAGAPVRGAMPGTHCVLLDVSAMPRYRGAAYPVESCLAWIYRETGIRAARHLASPGDESLNQCIRLAIPVGLNFTVVCELADRLVALFQSDAHVLLLTADDSNAARSEARFHLLDIAGSTAPVEVRPDRKMLERATNAASRVVEENYRVVQEIFPEVVRQLVEVKGGQVEVMSAGQGPVLLLMHPFNIGAGLFAYQFKSLSERFRVVTIHHPGVGATNAQVPLSLDGVADLFVHVLETLGVTGPMHIAGISAGGLQAQAFVHRYPHLSATLTLICSSYKVGNRDGKVSPLVEVIAEDMALIASHVDDPRLTLERQRVSETLLRCESMDPRMGLKYLDEFTHLPDLRAMLADIAVPSLILQGRHDSVISAQTTLTLRDSIPGAVLEMIETGGHFVTLTNAQECNDLIEDFLAQHQIVIRQSHVETLDNTMAFAK
ncbi:SDR family NAD(P)-dependent oxidoreductase [Pseudomonas sp. H3(2019)]|uniref:SDR family NAD(P)-dependent oxidoreductase n=1 Tax=Pseudomonas sp. H3(2019) TaxID=2598724 RepID=UPI0011916F3A|nr:SDR family NAD(P)-dependent oxidoreductase [Pseudomonas sp. H3(2019)]TVT86074.1 SDR family NAD(P)-dependent oxidoreductase [Pseudomonas sp. H3(2019)]